jgi:hypothetical protein
MKQYIDGDQIFKEISNGNLTLEQTEHLRELLDMTNGIYGQRCTIGKMIEILMNTGYMSYTDCWISPWNIEIDFGGKELCDVLWNAVKSIL